MPHSRPRLASQSLKKKLAYFRVVSIQGARQTGKSFLARELLPELLPEAKYVSLDAKTLRDQANENPDSFIESYRKFHPVMIDEAQKAPPIFDAVKLAVDLSPRPGKFILLGSTEFSREIRVRESLTGRLGKIRIYPMNFHETLGLEKKLRPTRLDLLKYLDHGGLPGIAFARTAENRADLMRDWLGLICDRDIHEFKTLKLDSDLALEILRCVAVLEEPTSAAIARKLRQGGVKVLKHIRALELLFCLERINPHPSSKGKPLFLPIDSGIVTYFGGDPHRRLHVMLMNELLCHWSYFGQQTPQLYYFRSSSNNKIDLVVGSNPDSVTAYQIFMSESVGLPQLNIMESLKKRVKTLKVKLFYPGPKPVPIKKYMLEPWEGLVHQDPTS